MAAGSQGIELLPTPDASHDRGILRSREDDYRPHSALTDSVARLLPTPTTALGDGGQTSRSGDRKGERLLSGIAQDLTLLPTPEAHQSGSSAEAHLARKPGRTKVTALNIVAEQLLPTPTAGDSKSSGSRNLEGSSAHAGVSLTDAVVYGGSTTPRLLPTPAVNDMGHGKTVEEWDEWTAKMKESHQNGNGHGPSLAIEAQRVGAQAPMTDPTGADAWGPYADAVRRWAHILGRPAPPPTIANDKGLQRLSPLAVEWMMGLPEGHVTDVPGLRLPAKLKALGNGVVPQQAAAGVLAILARSR